MRTAPAPDLLPIPGMNQGIAVAAGSGGAGDGDGSAGEGGDGEGAGGGSGGDDASGDNRDAPDGNPTTAAESHPVDVVTGRVFTLPCRDLQLPGPLPLAFERSYSSRASRQDQGLGFGWAHSFGWLVQVERRKVRVWDARGVSVSFPTPEVGHSVIGDWGWVLRRESWGFAVDANDDVWRIFSVSTDQGTTFRLSAIDDRNRNRIALTYDNGKLVEIKDSAGRVVKVTPNKEGRIAALEVKNAEHQGQWIAFARYEYDDKGRLVRAKDADGYAWTYAYDEFNRLVRETDRVGLTFCFRYDEKDRGIEAWGEYLGKKDPSLADDLPKFLYDRHTRAKGIFHRKLDYHDRGYTEVTDTTETRRYVGNRRGTVEKAISGGAVTTSKYDERGFEIEKTDPLGATTSWVRDERGRMLEVSDPLGRRILITRDAYGLPLEVVDAAGGVTRAYRDGRGNLQTVTDPVGATTQFVVDARGLVTAITGPGGAISRYDYDAQGNLVTMIQPNGGRWVFTYDGFGRRLSARDPAGSETRYVYSDRGDLLAVYGPTGDVTRYGYDGEQHVTQVVGGGSHAQFTWGGCHKLCARRDANGHLVRLSYDREGQLVAVTNEREEVQRLSYDFAGRLVRDQTFDGRDLGYRYDAAGRVVRIQNGAGPEITEIAYDDVGQIVGRTLPDGTTEAFEYDAQGRVIRATNAAGDFLLQRDAVGRVVREVQRAGDREHWVEVTYDAAGRRLGRKTSLGHTEDVKRDVMGARVATTLDGVDRMEHVSDLLTREVQRRLPRGGVLDSAFDPSGRLSQRSARSAAGAPSVRAEEPDWIGPRDDGVTAMASYAYDADGNLVSKHDRARGVTRFEYDPLGQLLAAVPEKARAEVFRYDAAGNVSEAGDGAFGRTYGAGNRLLTRGSERYEWDDDGRLVRKIERRPEGDRVWDYAWNGAGLLASVRMPDDRLVGFTYDPFGRRVSKQVRSREGLEWKVVRDTLFVWDGDVLVHDIRGRADDPVVEVKTYVFEEDGFAPMAHRDGAPLGDRPASGRWFHYANDPSGAPDVLVDDSGQVACELERAVWGGMRAPAGSKTATPLRLQGQYEDEETGLAYNWARYYDPSVGRYISRDPLGSLAGLNAFAYGKNPIGWMDPFGLETVVVPNAGLRPIPDIPGTFTLTAHGNPGGLCLNGKDMSTYTSDPKALAAYIRSQPGYKPGMPVRLASCSTGKGDDSIAEKLSKEMGVPMTAPNDTLWCPSGTIGPNPKTPSGSWRTFGGK